MGDTAYAAHREVGMPWTDTAPMKERMRFSRGAKRRQLHAEVIPLLYAGHAKRVP